MNRRSFMALASGLLVPGPTKAYSFLWAPPTIAENVLAIGHMYGMRPHDGETEREFRERLANAWGDVTWNGTRFPARHPGYEWRTAAPYSGLDIQIRQVPA